MKVVLQRVSEASVTIDGVTVGSIGKGFVALLGIGLNDDTAIADKMIDKIKKLRIFPDDQGKTNISISDVQGELMVISQFTLYADCRKGNRPSFTNAKSPEEAEALYHYFVQASTPHFKKVASGSFGADMKVNLTNDGPFTVLLEMD